MTEELNEQKARERIDIFETKGSRALDDSLHFEAKGYLLRVEQEARNVTIYTDSSKVIEALQKQLDEFRIQSLDAFDKQREKYEREIESIKDTHHLWGEISKRNAEIAALKSKLGEAEKDSAVAVEKALLEARSVCSPEFPPLCACSCKVQRIITNLHTPSDGEGKSCECRPGVNGTISFDCHQHGAPFYRKEEKKPDGQEKGS